MFLLKYCFSCVGDAGDVCFFCEKASKICLPRFPSAQLFGRSTARQRLDLAEPNPFPETQAYLNSCTTVDRCLSLSTVSALPCENAEHQSADLRPLETWQLCGVLRNQNFTVPFSNDHHSKVELRRVEAPGAALPTHSRPNRRWLHRFSAPSPSNRNEALSVGSRSERIT